MKYFIKQAAVQDAAEIIDFLNAIAKESEYLSIEENSGFWLSVEEEKEFIIKSEVDKSAVLCIARVFHIYSSTSFEQIDPLALL